MQKSSVYASFNFGMKEECDHLLQLIYILNQMEVTRCGSLREQVKARRNMTKNAVCESDGLVCEGRETQMNTILKRYSNSKPAGSRLHILTSHVHKILVCVCGTISNNGSSNSN